MTTAAASPVDDHGVLGMLVVPVALVAVAVTSGGAVEFDLGARTVGINTAQVAALVAAGLAVRLAWRRRAGRLDLLVLPLAGLAALPVLQGLAQGSGPLATGGIGRFVTVLVLLLALPQFRDRRHWDLPLVLMGVAIAVMVLAKVVPALGDGRSFYDLKDVVQLPLGNHNYVATILAAALAITVARQPPGRNWTTLAAGVTGLGLLGTLSRGGWLVAAIVLVVLAATRRDRATVVTVSGLAVAGVALLVAVAVTGGTDRGVLSPATDARLDLWAASWDAFLAAPLLGVGVDRLAEYMGGLRQAYVHAHNLVLESLATTGVVGAVAYLAYWAGAAVRAIRLDDHRTRLAVGLPLLALFTHAQVDSLSYFLVYEVVVATLLGVAAAHPDAALVRDLGPAGAHA